MSCDATNHELETQNKKINQFLQQVKHKLVIMSGKGGVGKSTVAANLAVFLSKQGYTVGLLDIDVHGPSIAGLLGLTGYKLNVINDKIQPYQLNQSLKVLTIQGLLDDPDQPLIWRGPMKIGIIRQFLSDVDWGALDFLIIDSPPGTGDEPLTIAQTIPDCHAIIITTPQEIALADVRKSIQFCRQVKMNILGLIENMSGFVCPNCGVMHPIFKTGGGKKAAAKEDICFLGQLPIDPGVVIAGDEGLTIDSLVNNTRQELHHILKNLLEQLPDNKKGGEQSMKIAIPLVAGKLCTHFGHCEQFAIVTVADSKVVNQEILTPPPHAPGVIPNWIADQGCSVLLVGGMGEAAQAILLQRGVKVICGAPSDTPEDLVSLYLSGNLTGSENGCDHGHEGHTCGNH